MTKDEIIEELLKKKVIIKKGNDFSFPKTEIQVKCKNLPDKYLGVSSRQAMKLFFIDAKIPEFSGGSLNYALQTITEKSLKIFLKILQDNSIDFSILVDRTSRYFNSTNTVKPSMSKYFTDGLWETVYHSYEKKGRNNDNIIWR